MQGSGASGAAGPALRVRLFGEFELGRDDGPAMAIESARAESLLAYLLLHRDAPQGRERIAFLLWPGSTESQARTNLRHVLHKLRRAVAELDRYVEVTQRTLRWRPDAPLWLDVAAFEEALRRAEQAVGAGNAQAGNAQAGNAQAGNAQAGNAQAGNAQARNAQATGAHQVTGAQVVNAQAARAGTTNADGTNADGMIADEAVTALREAVDLYRGDLLEGCYDEWLDGERQRLRDRFLVALHRLAGLLDERGEHSDAIRCVERLLRHDPLDEQTYRLLMRLHDAAGDRGRALRVYHVCAATLERELGTEPSAPTRRQYEALLMAEGEPAASPPGGAAVRAGAVRAGAVRAASPPLVGRAAERVQLIDAWRAVAAGSARLVLVTGEPGIGKTRLVEEFRSWCAHHGAVTAEAGAYAAEGVLAYGLIVSWLRSDGLAGPLRRLAPEQLTELARLLPELLTERPDLARPRPLPESELRQRLFDAVARAILAPGAPGAPGASVLLVADDLHWSDQESLRFLHYLLRVEPGARLLVAATARREDMADRHPLADLVGALEVSGRVAELTLGRFSAAETAVLARRFTGLEFDEAARGRLYGETEGNPLFVIEALRAGWHGADAGADAGGRTEAGRLSPRVQAVIESRLAQLSAPALDLVGVAATIGRDFTVDVLGEASGADEDALVRGLDELWQRRLVREHGGDGYDFTHGKIREVAYGSLTPARRRRHHLQVAHALERRYACDPGPVSGRLALHFERAGAISQAVEWHGRAAEAAQLLYAHAEALRLLDHALDLLRTLPPNPQRDTRELELQSAVTAPLVVAESFASPRLTAVHERAVALSGSLGLELSPPLLCSLAVASLTRGNFAEARRLGAELRELGSRGVDRAGAGVGGGIGVNDDDVRDRDDDVRDRDDVRDGDDDVRDGVDEVDGVLVVEAEYVLGIAEFWQGHFRAAREHFEEAVARYRAEDRGTYLLRYWLDPRVVCMSRLANTWWFLGRHAAAVRAREAALAWSDEVGHPATRSAALVFAALLSLELRDSAGLREHTAALLASPGDPGSKVISLPAQALAGYIDVLDGRPGPGLARIQSDLDGVHAVDPAPGSRAVSLRILLAAAQAAGDAEIGLATADRALAATDGVATWESEARRLRAEFLAAMGAPAKRVAAELDHALAVARRQGAHLFELRAATTMLRLADGDGDGIRGAGADAEAASASGAYPGTEASAARDRLERIVGGMGEAAGTPDLDEAVALLGRGSAAESRGGRREERRGERREERSGNATSANL